MNYFVSIALKLFLLIAFWEVTSVTALTTFEKKDKGVVAIATHPKQCSVIFSQKAKEEIQITVSAIFDIDFAQGNPTGVSGKLIFFIPDDARKSLSQYSGIAIARIPGTFEFKDVLAEVLPDSRCPAIKIVVPDLTSPFLNGVLVSKKQEMIIDEKNAKADIGKLFCTWTAQFNDGFGHAHRLLRPINKRILMVKTNNKKCCD